MASPAIDCCKWMCHSPRCNRTEMSPSPSAYDGRRLNTYCSVRLMWHVDGMKLIMNDAITRKRHPTCHDRRVPDQEQTRDIVQPCQCPSH